MIPLLMMTRQTCLQINGRKTYTPPFVKISESCETFNLDVSTFLLSVMLWIFYTCLAVAILYFWPLQFNFYFLLFIVLRNKCYIKFFDLVDDEEEYEEVGRGGRFLGFMFGNVNDSGHLDVDYLDEVTLLI